MVSTEKWRAYQDQDPYRRQRSKGNDQNFHSGPLIGEFCWNKPSTTQAP